MRICTSYLPIYLDTQRHESANMHCPRRRQHLARPQLPANPTCSRCRKTKQIKSNQFNSNKALFLAPSRSLYAQVKAQHPNLLVSSLQTQQHTPHTIAPLSRKPRTHSRHYAKAEVEKEESTRRVRVTPQPRVSQAPEQLSCRQREGSVDRASNGEAPASHVEGIHRGQLHRRGLGPGDTIARRAGNAKCKGGKVPLWSCNGA